jgi:hypothetical protein
MAYEQFPWDDVGNPNGMEVIEHCFSVSHQYSGGYSASRSDGTRILKSFMITMEVATAAQWLAFIEFWRAHHGSVDAFNIEFPLELCGSAGYGGYGGLEPADGFVADRLQGYGEGPNFDVRFVGDDLPQRYRVEADRWEFDFEVRQI